ncbi:MAG TPA: hypothetical protein VML95_11305 [Longimicrobiales bacterium]|nr:hypothetical protein [Longimicrobiales bacterium]
MLVHAGLFAFVGFGAPSPSDERARPARPIDTADAPSIRLIALDDAPAPVPARPSHASAVAPAPGDKAGRASAAPAAAPTAGGSEPAAPPVLLTFAQPTPSPLLLAGAVASEAPSDAAPRAASYKPGGVRDAKLGWSGQDEEKVRRAGRIRAALGVGAGDGHCPARPPRRGPLRP